MQANVLVLGGSGFVGRHLIEHLQRLGARVTVPTRRLAHAREVWPLPCATVLEADVTQPHVLAGLLPGHDAVVNLIATLHGNAAQFERLHVEFPRQLAAACSAAGVRRLVHLSALGAAADGRSRYQRSKAGGEAVLQQAARSGAIDLTVLRPSVIYGTGDHLLNLFARLQRLLPVIPLAAADARFQPVWVRDVAEAVTHSLQHPGTIGQTYEACGPEVFTLRQLVQLAGQWDGARAGRPPRSIIGVPAPLAWLQALLMECMPGTPLLSRDNLESMKVANVASGQLPDLTALGIAPASMLAAGPWVIGREGPAARLDDWRRGAGR